MTSNPADLTSATQLAPLAPHMAPPFEMRFTSTPRGARLARRLAAQRLDVWGVPYGTDAHDAIVLIVAELTANAVLHGHVPGRDFHLRLHMTADARAATARVEVTDTRGERVPPRPEAVAAGQAPDVNETGRGLLLVATLATRWGWHPRSDGPGKTVWAEYVAHSGPAMVQ
ncbi:ATP-binding protein [Streptomyces sp. AC627_RSS907]|uniref:ATP-binding protein n=1 Tax=Streptomyces sp. AC627_RSS907 TaxID=2823684 RepID=UPI001C235442|nr:ATP-binding protein [Streptomyces sp. AC627_RSS907]